MMNALLDNLLNLLEEETNIFRSIFDILEEETAALLTSNLNELNEVLKKKENEVLKIRLLEAKREKIVQSIANIAGCPAKGLTLSKLAGMVTQSYSDAIFKISDKLEQFTHSIRLLNQKNKKLVEQSLGLVRDSLSILDNLLSPVPVYHHTGKFLQSNQYSGRLVSNTI